jgi:hypothetical protein
LDRIAAICASKAKGTAGIANTIGLILKLIVLIRPFLQSLLVQL